MILAQHIAAEGTSLSEDQIRAVLSDGLQKRFTGARVLVLIPDHTRTLPLDMLFPQLVDILRDARQLDFMVALGTHPPLSEQQLCDLVGITPEQKRDEYSHVGLFNHEWKKADALVEIGTLTREQIQAAAGEFWHPSLGGDVPIRINRRALEYEQVVILGPIFPHEVVGFSGGAKYLFPGISGPEMIDMSHWLGALIGILDVIGIAETPMRHLIHAAAECLPTPVLLAGMVLQRNETVGLFIGDLIEAWAAAAELSAERNIIWVDAPYQSVLSAAPPMYDELWTAAKAMYKLEPAVADGGELIVYAPHLETVSVVHGDYLYEMGYHTRDYFLKQWDRFSKYPLGVLAHSTHLKGAGVFINGQETPRIQVTLASKISPEDCARLNLGYRDPYTINSADWQNAPGKLYVPKAGEMLYRASR
jgi:nickel-dependent lactate racemase